MRIAPMPSGSGQSVKNIFDSDLLGCDIQGSLNEARIGNGFI